MKIRKLQLKNIGVFDDETIEFQPCPAKDKAEIHIFTGQNGSGKSTLLMGLASGFYGWKEEFEETDEEILEKERELPKNLPVNTERSLFKRFRFFELTESEDVDYKSYISLSTDDYSTEEKDEYKDLELEESFFIKRSIDVFGVPKEYIGTDEIRSMTWSDEIEIYKNAISFDETPTVNFAVFAYSGYRFVKSEKVELLKENAENPLMNSLDFIKTYEKFTINQWIANNLSQRALAREENNKKSAEIFNSNVSNLAKIITEVVGYEIDFKLKYSPMPQLVLKMDGIELDFDVLPDGLRSLLSWIGDLLMRVTSLNWQNDLPITEKNLILLLDEIEVHLHPEWQRKVLPVVQKLFKNSQIFVSTHSPFVVNSVDDAWVYELDLKDGKAKVREKSLTKTTESIQTTLEEVFEVPQIFGLEVQKDLDRFYELRSKVKNNGGKADKEFREIAKRLLEKSEKQSSAELQNIVAFELKQLKYEL